jgi:putative endonuclease
METPDPVQGLLTRARGQLARQAVTGYLQRSGLRILAQDWTCTEGRIDIVAADRRVLVVCQVKHRRGGTPAPQPVISRSKARRLRRLAVRWLIANGVLFDEVRIDHVISTPEPAGSFIIEHVRGVA